MAQEKPRKCGYRKIGGIYLCSDGAGEPCHRLPFALDVCPVCHGGIKQSRGWTWLDWVPLSGGSCDLGDFNGAAHCPACVVCRPELVGLAPDKDGNVSPGIYNKIGLLWVGDKFYTPESFTQEAHEMGVSRRIAAVPHGFKLGQHYVFLAHPRAIAEPGPLIDGKKQEEPLYKAGIFHVFKPSRLEKILADTATDEEVKKWEDRGFTVVKLSESDKDHTGSVYDKPEESEAENAI